MFTPNNLRRAGKGTVHSVRPGRGPVKQKFAGAGSSGENGL